MGIFYVIRFFGLIFISLYTYKKILNINDVSKTKITSSIIFSLLLSILLSYAPPLYEVIFVASVFIYVSITARVNISLMITGVIVSIGISLGIEALVLYITYYGIIPQIVTSNGDLNAEFSWSAWGQAAVSIASFTLVHFFFKMKRLKKGFAFLYSKEGRWVGIIFSILIMIGRSIPPFIYKIIEEYSLNSADAATIIFFLFSLISVYMLGIHLWWRSHTNLLYHQRLAERIGEEYLAEIEEKDWQIKRLSDCNNFLSKAVHRDNKLVPAMYHAVTDFLSGDQASDTKKRGINILKELDDIMQERNEMIVKIQKEHKPIPATEIDRIDHILNYMRLRALEHGIQFDFLMPGKVKDVAESAISKQKLESLLADLIENAIIAVSYSPYKKILVTMGTVDDCFEINIQDSGIPFEVETLVDLGLKESTTHADDGGSGIGYLAIFKILDENNASLIISEQEPENYSFSKSIKIRFDRKSEFVIHSFRAEKIMLLQERESMSIFECHFSDSTHS